MPNILLDKSGEIIPKRLEEAEPKQKQWQVVDAMGDEGKV